MSAAEQIRPTLWCGSYESAAEARRLYLEAHLHELAIGWYAQRCHLVNDSVANGEVEVTWMLSIKPLVNLLVAPAGSLGNQQSPMGIGKLNGFGLADQVLGSHLGGRLFEIGAVKQEK